MGFFNFGIMKKNNLPVLLPYGRGQVDGKKVLVALSGGVDSSVAAAILANQGFEVIGIHFLMWKEDYQGEEKILEDLKKIVKVLGIRLEIVDIKKEFKEWVVEEFLESYKRGETPNPCVICNKKIKFNLLLKIANKLGCDFIATGHYARIKKFKYRNRIEYGLFRGIDERKDQSYFLYRLNQEILSRTFFPNGENTKEKTKELVRKFYLPLSFKEESQEICFISDSVNSFLKKYLGQYLIPGKVVDINKNILGEHYGLPLYTIGQRHGFRITSPLPSIFITKKGKNKELQPLYVVDKDFKKNFLIVGTKKQVEKRFLKIKDVSFIREKPGGGYKLKVKIRIRSNGNFLTSRVIYYPKKNLAEVFLETPQIGISPGQSAVFYKDNEVLGGGIII